MEDIERVRARLANIQAVKPILGALRTISLGSWQMALGQQAKIQRYSSQLLDVLPPVLAYLQKRHLHRRWSRPTVRRVAALVIGSERGLCGRFNDVVTGHTQTYLAEQAEAGVEVVLTALGTRLVRVLKRQGLILSASDKLSATTLPSFERAFAMTSEWVAQYEAGDLDAVDIIYNAYRGHTQYEPVVVRLLPPEIPQVESLSSAEAWHTTIVETDPLRLYARVIEQLMAIRCHKLLLESAASEHATRYHLMEAATQNTDRIVGELTLVVQSARRQAITREMQELAVGAGLVGR